MAEGRPAIGVLVTGFGPYPGVHRNPTGMLAQRLAGARRPALANARVRAHVFATSYAAIDRDLPELIAKFQPDAILMFGLAPRARNFRIELRARNAQTLFPDAAGFSPTGRVIEARGPALMPAELPIQRLLHAARLRGIAARPSRDAGRYVCNYLFWRALEAAARPGGPRLAAFTHVPGIRNAAIPRARSGRRGLNFTELVRTAEAILLAVVAAARHR